MGLPAARIVATLLGALLAAGCLSYPEPVAMPVVLDDQPPERYQHRHESGIPAPVADVQVAQAVPVALPEGPDQPSRPTGPLPQTPGLHGLTLDVEGQAALGLLAVPDEAEPNVLVVVVKGYLNELSVVEPFLHQVRDAGHLGLAMDFRGDVAQWKVDTAAADTVAATLAVLDQFPAVNRTVLFGYSMGGEASGMALALAPPGTFTHWVAGAGVMDLNATWREQPTLQPVIENLTGGNPADAPLAFASRSPIFLAPDIAAQNLTRAYLVHGASDTIVPPSHMRLMFHALKDNQVPVTAYTIMTGNDTWACALILYCTAAPAGPASHEAGVTGYLMHVLWDRIEGRPDATAPALHYAVESVTGVGVLTPI